jgi:hypothetical protein
LTDPAPKLDRPYLLVEPKPVMVKTRAPEPPPVPAALSPTAELPPIPTAPCNRAPEEVIRIVGFAYSASVEEIKVGDRFKTLAEARMVAYWMLRAVTKLSYPEIGRALGKDHTSAMYGVKCCNKKREAEPEFQAFTDELRVAVDARLKSGVRHG